MIEILECFINASGGLFKPNMMDVTSDDTFTCAHIHLQVSRAHGYARAHIRAHGTQDS